MDPWLKLRAMQWRNMQQPMHVYTVEICRVAFSEKAEQKSAAKSWVTLQTRLLSKNDQTCLGRWRTGTLKFLLSPSALGFSGRTMVHREHIFLYIPYISISCTWTNCIWWANGFPRLALTKRPGLEGVESNGCIWCSLVQQSCPAFLPLPSYMNIAWVFIFDSERKAHK